MSQNERLPSVSELLKQNSSSNQKIHSAPSKASPYPKNAPSNTHFNAVPPSYYSPYSHPSSSNSFQMKSRRQVPFLSTNPTSFDDSESVEGLSDSQGSILHRIHQRLSFGSRSGSPHLHPSSPHTQIPNFSSGKNFWTESETHELIRVYEELSKSKRGHDMWSSIHSKLTQLGVNKTESEVKKKWDNLTQSYRKCVDKQERLGAEAISGRKKRKFMFFDEMHRINTNRQSGASTSAMSPTLQPNSRVDEMTEDDASELEVKRPRISREKSASVIQVLYEWIEEERELQQREHDLKMKLLETVIDKLRQQ